MGDRIALMRKGRLVQVGSADDIYNRPVDMFAARFFSELNELEAVAGDDEVETAFGRFAAPGLTKGMAADVCVRPQGILLGEPGEGLRGRIKRRRFIGEVDLVEVAVEGLDLPLHARIRDGGRFAVGMDVGVRLDARDVIAFPRERAE